MKKRQRTKLVDAISLTEDVDELLELLSDSNSLVARAKKELGFRQAESNLIRKRLKQVRATSTEVRATDHAMIRYLERVVGINLEALKKEMLSNIPDNFCWTDETEYINLDVNGMRYVLRDRLIISVCPIGDQR